MPNLNLNLRRRFHTLRLTHRRVRSRFQLVLAKRDLNCFAEHAREFTSVLHLAGQHDDVGIQIIRRGPKIIIIDVESIVHTVSDFSFPRQPCVAPTIHGWQLFGRLVIHVDLG